MLRREVLSSHLQLEHVKQAVFSIETNMIPMGETHSRFVEGIVSTANQVVERMSQLSPNLEQGREGGVLLIQRQGELSAGYVAMEIIGKDEGGKPEAADEVERSNADKHTLYAIGKALVLVNNPTLLGSALNKNLPDSEQQHITLRGKDVPGGAIRVKGTIYSFSGYATPEEDECVILATLETRGILSRQEALDYAECLNNSKYSELAEQIVVND